MLWRFMERLIRQEGADQGQPKSIRFFLGILNFFSKGYTLVVRIRAWLYDKAFLPQFPLGCQVISIGNLTVGNNHTVTIDLEVTLIWVHDYVKVLVTTEDLRNDITETFFQHANQSSTIDVLGVLELLERLNHIWL